MRPLTLLKGLGALLLVPYAAANPAPLEQAEHAVQAEHVEQVKQAEQVEQAVQVEQVEQAVQVKQAVQAKQEVHIEEASLDSYDPLSVLKCKNDGKDVTRRYPVEAIDYFCAGYHDFIIDHDKPLAYEISIDWGFRWIIIKMKIDVTDETKVYRVDKNVCARAFRKIVDGCNTNGRDRKQGGVFEAYGIAFVLDVGFSALFSRFPPLEPDIGG